MRPPLVRASLVLACGLMIPGGFSHATTVSGQVTNASGQGISNVNIDFIDRVTGVNIALSNDNTDVLGFYAVSVPAGFYNVRFKPSLGTRYVGLEVQAVTVQGTSMVLNQVLQTGWIITGRVVDGAARPVASVDLDVLVAATGATLYTNHDVSDSLGNFNVVVPTGTYQIRFNPPAGTGLVAVKKDGVVVSSDKNLGDVVLPVGVHLRGEVHAADDSAVVGATVRALDPATGSEVLTANNKTDSAGRFDLVVLPAVYDARVDPARGSHVVPRTVFGVTVASDFLLPTVVLDAGVIVSGTVQNTAGTSLKGIDLDFFNAFSGMKQFTPHDSTDDTGAYAVTVRPGMYVVTFDPLSMPGIAPQSLAALSLTTDQTLPTVRLPQGFFVTGSVKDALSNPIAAVHLGFVDRTSGKPIFTVRDHTDAAGEFSVVVPAAVYDIRFTPPDGSGSGETTVPQVTIGGNLSLGTVTLPSAFPAVPQAISPVSGDASGGTLVTVSGSGFAPGVVVKIGGVALDSIVRLDSGTVQGLTRARPPGVVDVQVINPGGAPAILAAAFTYVAPASDPSLTLVPSGPLGNDLLLTWTSTGRSRYTVFRSSSASHFTDLERIDVIEGTTFLDEGALSRPGPSFYVIQ